MKFLKSLAAGAALVALVATPAVAMLISRVPLVPDASQLPGRHADGSVQLINQRTITPAGQQSDLGDLLLNAILSPDGKRLLVSNSGAGVQSLEVVDTSSGKILQDTKYLVPDSVFIGLTYSPDGKKVYASGGGSNLVHTFNVGSDGLLTPTGDWKRATQSCMHLHALIERFGSLDNFYADAGVSADGHNWAMSAYASDYNEKMWPQDYSPAVGRNRGYDFEGATRINLSAGGYLWDSAAAAGISYRDYGEFLSNGGNRHQIPASQADSCPGPIAASYTGVTVPPGQVLCWDPTTVNVATTPNLVGHFDEKMRGYDLRYREADRVAEWKREFDQFVANNNLPQLEIMRLLNDHTSGTALGRLTPQAYVAENDLAVGQVVDIVSHSKYWTTTAIFITEDDAQNGPDHVDSHRTTSLVISPYNSRGEPFVDHTLYDTSAMLRTIELILGLHPLSQFDANATPIRHLFRVGELSEEQLEPYSALNESISATDLNAATAFGAEASAAMDFEQEDRAPMMALNQVIWHAVRGMDVPCPDSASGAAADADGDGA